MKQLFVTLYLILFIPHLFSQVNFDLDFSFNKIISDDELANIQLYDINDDGIEEIFASYASSMYENHWSIVSYSQTGEILNEITQETIENEHFQNSYLFSINNINYLLTTFKYKSGDNDEEVYLKLKLFNFDTNSLICEYDKIIGINQFDDNYVSYSIKTTDIIHQEAPTSELLFYIGIKKIENTYSMPESSTHSYESNIFKFQLINNELTFLEKLDNVGDQLFVYDTSDNIISTEEYYNSYTDDLEGNNSIYRGYRISLVSNELESQIQEVYHINGEYNNYYGFNYYENYPEYFSILTYNDLNFQDYGLIAYHKNSDTENSSSITFENFSPNFSNSSWISNNSHTGDNQIKSSTCISINNESNYIMYFRNNQLEIRNRLDGSIEHHQNSTISPFKILRKLDDELLFFIEKEDLTGYNVFTVDGEIQVGAEEHNIELTDSIIINNYPNPFNPSTNIKFIIEASSNIELTIFNVKGQKIKTLVHSNYPQGVHTVIWNGENESGKPVSSGIYYYHLKSNGKTAANKRCLLLK
ncbi:MAG: FlgD immunoglobulin-like domain containing protein [Candidatus Cloacimonadales bacterium]